LLEQSWGDSTSDVPNNHGLARFHSKDMSRVHTHIGAAYDDRPHVWQCSWKRRHQATVSGLRGGKGFIAF
jgi:hypothetical protein